MRGRRAGALLALTALVMVLAGPLSAPALAATTLKVEAGHGGLHLPGKAVPVRVTVSADRLVHGELAVVVAGRREPLVTEDVEVAGGSVKRFLLVMPGGFLSAGRSDTVTVELREGGRTTGEGEADLRTASDTELVGLAPGLGGDRPLSGPAQLAADTGVARFVAVDAPLITAPGGIDALSTVALAAGELAALAPTARDSLLRWVASGGQLLLDDAPGAPVDGLPAAWQPEAGGRAAAERGEVRLTDGAVAAGRWAGLVEPTSGSQPDDSGAFFSPESVGDSLAGDSGLRRPGLGWLLGFLGVYILVAGPVTGLVLRRRGRPELAWLAVPGLAVVFTAVAWGAGNQLRPGDGLAHTSVVETGGPGPVADSWIGFTRRSAGTARVALPTGWAVQPMQTGSSRSLPTTGRAESGREARLPLTSGEFGLIRASGPVSIPGRLEVTAGAEPNGGPVKVTVRNGMPFPLEDVAVFSGPYRTLIGDLAPGAWKEQTLDDGRRGFDPSGFDLWSQRFPVERDGAVNLALWQAAQVDTGLDPRAPTGVMAVGWTREWKPDVTVDGRTRPAPGRTAVIGRGPLAPGTDEGPAVARREIVRGPFPNVFGGWEGSNDPTVAKFTLPPGEEGRNLVLRTSFTISDLSVWRDGVWEPLGGFFGGGAAFFGERGRIFVENGGVVFDRVEVPATTTSPPVPMPELMPVPMTGPPVRPVPPPPNAVPPDIAPGFVNGNAISEIALPPGTGADGVVFVRLVIDPSSMVPDATLSLEVAR